MIDFHIHSNTSRDCQFTATKMILSAKEKGMSHICLTNHHEIFEIKKGDLNQALTSEKIKSIKEQIKAIDGINVGVGVEIGYLPEIEKEISTLLKSYDFDYVLGSIHYLDGFCIGSEKNKGKAGPDIYKKYFKSIKQVISSGLFDMIGHIDIYKRVADDLPIEKTKDEWNAIAKLLIKHDIGFEVNTSYSKVEPHGTFPNKNIIKLLVNRGVKKITLGSDSYKPHRIGTNFKETVEFLKSIGVKEVFRFEKRKPIPVPIAEL